MIIQYVFDVDKFFGKTFIALHRMIRALEADEQCQVLFVAPHPALAHFVGAWLCARLDQSDERDEILGRLWALVPPFEEGLRRCLITDDDRVEFEADADAVPAGFDLLVCDEAHHIYSQPALLGGFFGHGNAPASR